MPGDTVLSYYSSKYGVIQYVWTRDEAAPKYCPLCRAGTCIQRVERSSYWEEDLVIHLELAKMH